MQNTTKTYGLRVHSLNWVLIFTHHIFFLDGGAKDSKPAVVQTSRSLDASSAPPTIEDQLKKSDICVSLDSILARRSAATATDGGPVTGYHVPGIGPAVSDGQVQAVSAYFRKCAADNCGYVYDFDIENDHCPQLDAINK